MRPDTALYLRRISANLLDTSIEISGGILGSYFGMMMAALLESAKDVPGEQVQSSMWSGFGFGFLFWALAISFINRVLIQGLSRASIGKKVFKLELISTSAPITWSTIFNRWTMGFGSFFLAGLGYAYALIDKEGRTFHDIAVHTDVVPVLKISSLVVEHQDSNVVPLPIVAPPTATVIQLPVAPAPVTNLAQVIRIHAGDEDKSDDSDNDSQAA